MSRWKLTSFATAVAAGGALLVAVPFATGGRAENARASATLQLNGVFDLVSIRDAPCPPGTRPDVLCPGRTGRGVVPGLGSVTEAYSYIVAEADPSCPVGIAKVFGYSVRWVVAGKGEIHFALHELQECSAIAFTADQSFTITGGTGIYVGASGSGTADRSLAQNALGAVGRETWTGTLTVPGVDFDVTRPQLSGAGARMVRARKGQKRVRVTYRVSARDDRDGSVPVSCRPASGSRFRVGRTTVTCSAADSSGNTATARFAVTVRAGR